MNSFRTRPHWVDEEQQIQEVLHHLLDQIDRGVKPQFRITEKSTPAFFDYLDDDPYYLWDLLKSLDNEYHLITVKRQRSQVGRESFDNAQLYLNPEKEGMLREWLNRPALDPYSLVWTQRLEKIRHHFEDGGHALENPIRVEGKGADEVLNGFVSLSREILQAQTLRNLSSKCFWAYSKFLDHRLELVCALFPSASHNILPRPLLLNVVLPEAFDSVIFIENLDSFMLIKEAAIQNPRLMNTALIYSGGFKASSSKVRKRHHVLFSYLHDASMEARKKFENWWLMQSNEDHACFFWGDLDFAGMAVLAALRKPFPNLLAWQPAYEAMLKYLEAGLGHSARDAKKEQQKDPEETGCAYSDSVLLPHLRDGRRFLDQEILSRSELIAL